MRDSGDNIFEVADRRPTETIQGTFARRELTHVVKVTEFTAMLGSPETSRFLQSAPQIGKGGNHASSPWVQ